MWKLQVLWHGQTWGSQVDKTHKPGILFPWWLCSENRASGVTCLFKPLIIIFSRKDRLFWVFDNFLSQPVLEETHKCWVSVVWAPGGNLRVPLSSPVGLWAAGWGPGQSMEFGVWQIWCLIFLVSVDFSFPVCIVRLVTLLYHLED